MVVAIMKVYNEAQYISAALTSLKNQVDKIIVVDGAYQLYYETYRKFDKTARPWSTDGTLEIIQALKGLPDLVLVRCKDAYPNQCDKLNAMIDLVEEDEWYFIMDADEIAVGDLKGAFQEIQESGVIVGRIPLVNLGCDVDRLHYFWHPRMFKKFKGMHYEGTHWQLRDEYGRIIENVYPVMWSQKCVVAHFKMLKTLDRVRPHLTYMHMTKARGWLEPLREELTKAA